MTALLHPLHQEIRDAIRARAVEQGARYFPGGLESRGSTKPCYLLRAAVGDQIARAWIYRHREITLSDCVCLFDSLAQGETFNEFASIGALLRRMPQMRRRQNPRSVAQWLGRSEGWAEVDGLCIQFGAQDLLSNWDRWRAQLVLLAKSKNIQQRRASLVLLTKPVRESDDPRLAELAFENVERLKAEKHILITKAVSWILRTLIQNHRQRVIAYLDANETTLPRIALRETRVKLKTGKKAGRLS